MSKRVAPQRRQSTRLFKKARKEAHVCHISDLVKEMITVEMARHMDKVSVAFLGSTCRQFRRWLEPSFERDPLVLIATAPLRFARLLVKARFRAECCYSDESKRAGKVVAAFARNPEHETIDSVYDVYRLYPTHNIQENTLKALLVALIEEQRDELIRVGVRSSSYGRLDMFMAFLARSDFMAVFAAHDVFPEVTRLIENPFIIRDLTFVNKWSPTTVAHLLQLARVNPIFAANARSFCQLFNQGLERMVCNLWDVIVLWRIGEIVGVAIDRAQLLKKSDDSFSNIIANKFRYDNDALETYLPWLSPGMIRKVDVIEGFLDISSYDNSFFMERWKQLDAAGFIDTHVLTRGRIIYLLHDRTNDVLQFLREWALARPACPRAAAMAGFADVLLNSPTEDLSESE